VSVNVSDPKAVRHHPHPSTLPNPLFLRDEELTRGLDLLDCALRGLLAAQASLLAQHGLVGNQQRLLHFIARRSGSTMVELGAILQLTKQSMSRHIKDLQARGLVTLTENRRDRRARLLALTEHGRRLEQELTGSLRRRLASAYRAAGAEAVAGHHQVLAGLIDERTRRYLDSLN
jgi:DNA-binding MarR family transcriptional regulator